MLEVSQIIQQVDVQTVEQIVLVAEAGQRGRDGTPGITEGSTFNATASGSIHGGRIVRIAAGLITHPQLADASHAQQCIGLALQSGSDGATLSVRTAGQVTDAGWSWSPGAIFCADDGVLTQTPPSSGWLLKVATAITATTIDIDLDIPFFRS